MTETLRSLIRGMAAESSAEPDAALVRRYVETGGDDVFETLVRRHGPMVLRVCWRVAGHEQDAEDAFQATFFVLARNLRSLRRVPSLASWLHGVARRTALKAKARAEAHRRRECRRPANGPVAPADPGWAETAAVLDEELSRLPARWREPLVLCHLEAHTLDEAARTLGWSRSTLRRRLVEAREALAGRLIRRGVWPAALAGALAVDCLAPAAVPPRLAAATVRVAAGRTAAGVASDVSALTEGVVMTMPRLKLTIAAAVLAAGLLVVGTGAAGNPAAPPDRDVPTPTADPAKAGPPRGSAPAGEKTLALQPPGARAPTPLDRWQGRWRVTHAAIAGKDRKDERVGLEEIVVAGKRLTLRYRAADAADPAALAEVAGELELIPPVPGKGPLADPGFTFHLLIPVVGVYHFAGDTLVVCYIPPGSPEGEKRPVGFGSWAGSTRELYRLERARDERPPARPEPPGAAGPKAALPKAEADLPPDLSGRWHGPEWGRVELARTSRPGTYVGTYDDTFGPVKGSITLEWMPREGRYHGRWGEGTDRFGTLSVRRHGGEIRGAFTTDPGCKLRPGVPALSDLRWTPPSAADPAERPW